MRKPAHTRRDRAAEREVKTLLKRIETSRDLGSPEEGENSVCAVCAADIQPCLGNPAYECRERNLAETELYWLVKRMKETSNGNPAACLMCGKTLTARQLKSNRQSELCPSCRRKSARVQRGNV